MEATIEPLPEWEIPPSRKSTAKNDDGWVPDLNPTQQRIFDDPSRFILGHSEKGTGKSVGFAHKLVRHAYENRDALVIVISPMIRTGTEGIWHDIVNLVLPQWVAGFGLEHTEPKLDQLTKDRHIWVGNRFGGWSKLLLISIPHASQVEGRIKGPAPSFVYVDELTECDGREYFTLIAAQVGRRRGIDGPQQYCASCNPRGPTHWVYKVFFEECIDPDTGQRDPDYAVYHVPIMENVHRLPPGYVEQLQKIFKSDPIQYRRLIKGEWIDKPSGEAIFKDYWRKEFHVRGDATKRQGLRPIKGIPVLVGHDPGPANYCISLLQMVPTEEGRIIAIIFDELNYVGRTGGNYKKVVASLLRRMDYWDEKEGYSFTYEHIADEEAFSKIHGDGNFDYTIIQNASKDPETGIPKIKLKPCPKGADSVPAGVRLIGSMLYAEELFVSALCPKTIEMFDQLESQPLKNGEYDDHAGYRPRRSVHIHPFDSLRYPIFYVSFGGTVRPKEHAIEPKVYIVGGGLV